MGGGGKGGTSTTTVSIPPEVLARYNAVNARAEQVAQTTFQPYGGEFVAPMNTVQQQGVAQTQQYAGAAQPYYQQAAGITTDATKAAQLASAPLTAQQIAQYQSPYVQSVVDPTLRALRQAQGIDLAKQQAQQIQTGAFGGDRAGLSRAMLQGQQELAQAQAISPLYQQAYQNALQTAQQQQQLGLAGAQAQLAGGQQLAGIGTGAQQAGLQGAQAVIGAGTLGQQTQQALDTAQYQQFLQERGYPFQTTQFLANIAEGTGALSGSTSTSTQPTSFFSDERLKTDIKKIATAKNGLPIYSFKYKDDPKTTHIGFIAQDVEKEHPEAVGLSGGYKTVDYGKALREARAMGGGLLPSSMGGGVWPANDRQDFAGGGGPMSLQDILAQQHAFQSGQDPSASPSLPYAGMAQKGLSIPMQKSPAARAGLMKASPPPQQQQYGLRQAMGDIGTAGQTASTLSSAWDKLSGKKSDKTSDAGVKPSSASSQPQAGGAPPAKPETVSAASNVNQPIVAADAGDFAKSDLEDFGSIFSARGGGIKPRHFGTGGFSDPYKLPTSGSMVPEDVMEASEESKDESEKNAPKPEGQRGGGGGGGLGGVGSAISGIASLAGLFLHDGGRVRYYNRGGLALRHGYQTDGTVQSDQAPQYKVQPIELEQMPDYQQALLKEIYGPESGGKYNIRYGGVGSSGKTFDVTGPHPNIPERRDDGRTSTAAGAGQFLGSTWQDITGGAPMLPGYQNAATLALAQRDYKARTGRDLNADLQERGVTPEIKSALAPTWESFAKQGYGKQTAQQYPFQQQVEGGLGAAKDFAARMVPADYRGRETVLVNPKTGEERPREWGDFLTSRDFILPLMAGLGTMASSPSRYLGAAILQGLGGAATAYQGVQNQQLARDEAMARAQETLAKLPAQVPEYEKGKLKVESKEQSFGPSLKAGPAPVGGVKPPPTADEVAGAAPIAPQAPSAPVIVQPTPKSMDAATTEIRSTLPMSPSDKAARDARVQAILNDQLRAKTQAEQGTSLINQLTVPLASLSAGEQIAPGPLSQPISTLVNYWNNIANQFKFPDEFKIDPTAASDIQVARKAATLLAGARAEDIGQTAYNALKTMANATANPEMNREAAAEIMAQAYIDKQRAIDEAIYTQKYSKANPALGMAGESAATEFRNTPGFTTADEMRAKAALKDLILQSTKETDDSGKTVKKSLLGYMLGLEKGTHAGKISPQTVDELFYKQYGVPNISRYFLNTTR